MKELRDLLVFLERYGNDHQSPYDYADLQKDIGYRQGVSDALGAVRGWAESFLPKK